MTFLEKLKEDEPYLKINENCRGIGCPKDRGYEKDTPVCRRMGAGDHCKKCWNREMPDTEEFVEPKCTFETEVKNAYNKGLNDAWELVRKIFRTDCADLQKVFGHSDEGVVIMTFDVQEALAKLKAYEEAQIKVGDVVELLVGTKCVVTSVNDGGAEGITEHGTAFYNLPVCDLKKTGKHIDISSILEQIGE